MIHPKHTVEIRCQCQHVLVRRDQCLRQPMTVLLHLFWTLSFSLVSSVSRFHPPWTVCQHMHVLLSEICHRDPDQVKHSARTTPRALFSDSQSLQTPRIFFFYELDAVVYTRTSTQTQTHTNTHTHTPTHTHMHTHAHAHTHACKRTRTHAHTHGHMHTHTYSHQHTQTHTYIHNDDDGCFYYYK